MDLFGSRPDTRAAKARIRGWATELLELGEADTVSVAELSCSEPGCPPHETVVLIARAGRPTVQHKVHKPAGSVVRDDLLALTDHEGDPSP
jgi:hypothetical protein